MLLAIGASNPENPLAFINECGKGDIQVEEIRSGSGYAPDHARGVPFDDLFDLPLVLPGSALRRLRWDLGSVDPFPRGTAEAPLMTTQGLIGVVGIVIFALVFIAGLQLIRGLEED